MGGRRERRREIWLWSRRPRTHAPSPAGDKEVRLLWVTGVARTLRMGRGEREEGT